MRTRAGSGRSVGAKRHSSDAHLTYKRRYLVKAIRRRETAFQMLLQLDQLVLPTSVEVALAPAVGIESVHAVGIPGNTTLLLPSEQAR